MSEQYTISEILKDVNEYGFTTWEKLQKQLPDMKTFSNFGVISPDIPLLNKDTFGFISLNDLFNNNNSIFDNQSMSENELLEEYNNSVFDLKIEDNTYNYSSPIERELDYKVFECVDDNTALAFFKIHTGIDVRAGYTDYFCMQFNSVDDVLYFLDDCQTIAYISFIYKNNEYSFCFDGSALSEEVNVYATINNNESEELENKIDLYEIDLTSGKKEALNDLLQQIDINKKDIENVEIDK